MPKKLLLTILLIVSVMTAGCTEFFSETGKFTKAEKGEFKDLEINIELQKTTFKKGDTISVLFILKNNGANTVQLDDQGFDAGIYRLDGTFMTYIRGDNYPSKPMNLGTDVSFIESIDWYMGDNLEPGKYYIVGYLRAGVIYKDSNDKIGPYTIKTRPLEMTIE